MSQEFEPVDRQHSPGRPASGTRYLSNPGVRWSQSGTPGFLTRPLLEDGEHGQRTWLIKIEAGAFAGEHTHDELEQVFVIEGSFYDQDNTYTAGDYLVRAPGAVHTAGSDTGAIILVIYSD